MPWNDKNILITGISGFVGSYLAEELIKEGANVHGLIRRRSDGSIPKNIKFHSLEDKFNWIMGDLTDFTSLENAINESEPDYVFHLAAQSFVPQSFSNPTDTETINSNGTNNLLEAIRTTDINSKIIFAGSSEEYGLVFSSKEQYENAKQRYGNIFPDIEGDIINELPISETNPLRPMSPYAVSKVYGEYLCRNYYHSYGMDSVISRAFNHEGAGRGKMFVTSVITNQVMQLKLGLTDKIIIGNVNAFRDWTHVNDIIKGYMTLAQIGKSGESYNQGSMRTNSILSYILLSLERSGEVIKNITTFDGDKKINSPTEINQDKFYGVSFNKTKIDSMMLNDELEYTIKDKGINVNTEHETIKIEFNSDRFRPAEVPILFSNTEKIQKLGIKNEYSLTDIITDQLEFFKNPKNQ